MFRADILFGYSCNNNCMHCFNPTDTSKLKDRKAKEIKKVLADAKSKGAESCIFTGGEVPLRKDFFELLKFARNLGLGISLLTNGRVFCGRKFAEKAISIAPDMGFVVALHHSNPRVHDRITRVRGSWGQTVKGIKNLLELGSGKVSLKVVVSKLNYRNLPALVGLAGKLGVKTIYFTFIQDGGNASKYWPLLVPRYSKISQYMIKALEKANKIGIETTAYAVPFCFLKGYEKHVSEVNSYVLPWMKGQVIERDTPSSRENIIEDMVLRNRQKAAKCRPCRYFNICLGVWKSYIMTYGSGEFSPARGKKIGTPQELDKLLGASR